MTIDFLHRLLAEGESSHLDYKSEQYRFAGASGGDKAELLKDILAMANAWRDTDAYILIGVKEEAGRKASVVGITEHLDDADLQEFVNKKTNRPIHFSYKPFEADSKTIAILHIPLQQRPFFVHKRFASVDANAVYLRRGSSTDVADADEIHSMGLSASSPAKPTLHVEFADLKNRQGLGQVLSMKRELLRPLPEDKLPRPTPESGGILANLDTIASRPNPAYWHELVEYMCLRSIIGRVGFAIRSKSSIAAMGVCVKLTTPHVDHVLLPEYLPWRPRTRLGPTYAAEHLLARTGEADLEYKRHGNLWHLEITFGRVQPGATIWTEEELLIGTIDEREVVLAGHIFGDNFEPVPLELRVASDPKVRDMTVKELRAEHEREDEDEE